MKHIAIIGTLLPLLILTAGCLDDLSSTLPPCCDGTCNMTKTDVINVSHDYDYDLSSVYCTYITDSSGEMYAVYQGCIIGKNRTKYDPYNNHNVTFSYEMVNGHRHITGIIEDRDAKPKCDCCQCELQNPILRYHSKSCECVQEFCGCEGE